MGEFFSRRKLNDEECGFVVITLSLSGKLDNEFDIIRSVSKSFERKSLVFEIIA